MVLITAGPTYEPIDAVRFIGNYSSGKMGFAIAEALANYGSKVILVSGPVSLKPHHPNISYFPIKTADEMLNICLKNYNKCDGAILSAAVSDYKAVAPVNNKIKRKAQNITIELQPNPDIAASLGIQKKANQFLAGFALETDNEISNATEKLIRKNFDFIVLNSLNDKGSGFNSDNNKITIINKDNNITRFELKPKNEVANDIVDYLLKYLCK